MTSEASVIEPVIEPAIDPASLSGVFAEVLIARIDEHLAAIPKERSLMSVDEHTDMLLDIRLLAAAGRATND